MSSAASTVLDIGAEAVETVAEAGAAVVERLAPGLIDFLRGGASTQFTDLFCAGVDTLVGRVFSAIGEFDFMSVIESTFTGLANGVRETEKKLREKTSEQLGEAMGWLVEGLADVGHSVPRAVEAVSDTINGVYTTVWEQLAAPALDFLQGVGGEVWERVSRMVAWIWAITEPLRAGAGVAWNWLLEQFHLARTARAACSTRCASAPARSGARSCRRSSRSGKPLMVAGGILVLLSPLGPIVLLTQVIPPLWEKLTWLWQNWNTRDILVRAQDVLRDDVLPGILGAISGVAGAFYGRVVAGRPRHAVRDGDERRPRRLRRQPLPACRHYVPRGHRRPVRAPGRPGGLRLRRARARDYGRVRRAERDPAPDPGIPSGVSRWSRSIPSCSRSR